MSLRIAAQREKLKESPARREVDELIDLHDASNLMGEDTAVEDRFQSLNKRLSEQGSPLGSKRSDLHPWGATIDMAWSRKDLFKRTETVYYISKHKKVFKKKTLETQIEFQKSPNSNLLESGKQKEQLRSLFEDHRRSGIPSARSPFSNSLALKPNCLNDSSSKCDKGSDLFRSPVLKPAKEEAGKERLIFQQKKVNSARLDFQNPSALGSSIIKMTKNYHSDKDQEFKIVVNNRLNNVESILKKKEPLNSCLSLNRNPYFLGKVRRLILDTSRGIMSRSSSLKKIELKRGIVVIPKKLGASERPKNIFLDTAISGKLAAPRLPKNLWNQPKDQDI